MGAVGEPAAPTATTAPENATSKYPQNGQFCEMRAFLRKLVSCGCYRPRAVRLSLAGLIGEPTLLMCPLEVVMYASPRSPEVLLTPRQAAAVLYVAPKTVTRWAVTGRIPCIRTPGGHRRYKESDVLAIMSGLHPWPSSPDMESGHLPPAIGDLPRNGAPGRSSDAATGDDAEAAAAAVIADAVAIALEAAATEAAEAVMTTATALSQAAQRAAEAAQTARGARQFAAAAAAEMVARDAERTATRAQLHADAAAARVADAAELAADELLRSISDGPLPEAADLAILLAKTVRAAADAMTQDTLRQSVAVEAAVAAAAAHVARMVVVAEEAIAKEVTQAAEVLEKEAGAAAATLAQKTDARAAGMAIAAREAAAAMLVTTTLPGLPVPSRSGSEAHSPRPSLVTTL